MKGGFRSSGFSTIFHWTRYRWSILSWFAAVILLFSGCGIYSFSGSMTGNIRSVAIPPFENQTAEFGIAEMLSEAVEDQFRSDNTLKIKSMNNADSIIYGTIVRVDDNPSTYNADESVEEYKITVTVQVRYEDRLKGKTVWEENISNFGIYAFTGGSSADRDQGLQEAVEKLAEDILNKTVSGW